MEILVNSAGTNIGGGKRNLGNMSLEGWDEVVASLIISPTWNRLVIGGLEAPKS